VPTLSLNFHAGISPHDFRILRQALALSSENLTSVGRQGLAAKQEPTIFDSGEARNRCFAGTVEFLEKSPLADDGDCRLLVVDCLDHLRQHPIGGSDFNADGALSQGGKHVVHFDGCGDFMFQSESDQPCTGKQRRIDLTLSQLLESGVDIASEGREPQIAPPPFELGCPTHGRRADERFLRQALDGSRLGRNQRIPWVLSR